MKFLADNNDSFAAGLWLHCNDVSGFV